MALEAAKRNNQLGEKSNLRLKLGSQWCNLFLDVIGTADPEPLANATSSGGSQQIAL